MDARKLEDAMRGLRGWRSAGEQYANRGGSILPLDYQVDVALDEIEWRLDPEYAREDEIERPDEQQLAWGMAGMQAHFGDCGLGEDLQVVHAFLEQPLLFSERELAA